MKRHCGQCKNGSVKLKFKPVTHVIFDLDGVILDTEAVYKEGFRKTVEEYGQKFTDDVYKKVSGATSANVARIAKQYYNLGVPIEDFVRKYRAYSKEGLKDPRLLPGVEKLIRHLHDNGVPLAIATSSGKEYVYMKMKGYMELLNLFDPIICGDDPDVAQSKPAPDVYLVCASKFVGKPSPSKCLVFEDSGNGMQAGLAAGMQVVMIPNETISQEIWNLATVKIDSFDDMVPEWFGLPPFTNNTE